jgi:hypothetical protein
LFHGFPLYLTVSGEYFSALHPSVDQRAASRTFRTLSYG